MSVKKDGFVAMLDILGFSEQVARDSEVQSLDKYVNTVIRISRRFENLSVILFSDTVGLFTADDTEDSFYQIVTGCSQLVYSLLQDELPIRGAVAHGSFHRSEDSEHGAVIAGRPIIEAHHYESQLQWIGVMLAPSVLRRMPHLAALPSLDTRKENESSADYFSRMRLTAKLRRWEEIPIEMHGRADRFDALIILPTSPEWNEIKHTSVDLKQIIEWLKWLQQLAPDPRSQVKYRNSIRILSEISRQWTAFFPD